MNKVFIVGRLVKDPELRYSINNVAVCRFTLAVNRPKQKDKEQEADFISCVAYNKLAENITKYQTKGNLLAIIGRIQTGSYNAQDGTKRYTTDVVVNEAQFLTAKPDLQNSGQDLQSNGQDLQNLQSSEQEKLEEENLEKYTQLSTTTVMNEDYNPELKIDDSMLPF